MSHCINIQIWTNFPIFLKHPSTPNPSECFQRRLGNLEQGNTFLFMNLTLRHGKKIIVQYMYKLFTDRYFGWLNINNNNF